MGLKILETAAKTAAALTLGLVAGSVIAQTAALTAFNKTSLYEAFERLHRDTGTDFVFANKDDAARKTFDLQPGTKQQMIRSAAGHFGKEDTQVSSIVILEDALPDASTSWDRIKTAVDYLNSRVPHSDKQPNPGVYYNDMVMGEANAISTGIALGNHNFVGLSPDMQQRTLNLLRANQYLFAMDDVGDLSYYLMKRNRK